MSTDREQMNEIVTAAAAVVLAVEAGDTASTEMHELREALVAFDPGLVGDPGDAG